MVSDYAREAGRKECRPWCAPCTLHPTYHRFIALRVDVLCHWWVCCTERTRTSVLSPAKPCQNVDRRQQGAGKLSGAQWLPVYSYRPRVRERADKGLQADMLYQVAVGMSSRSA
jgi:hypothetical protein